MQQLKHEDDGVADLSILKALFVAPSIGKSGCVEVSALPCENRDLCTNSLTHIKCGFMLCILYVRNGGRYDGLWIRAGEHRRSVLIRPISRTQSRKMRQNISGENQW